MFLGLFAIGVCLVEFLVERELITIKTEDSYTDVLPVSKKKGHGFKKQNCFAMCNFDLSILPIKLNLPMVSKPIPWYIQEDSSSSLIMLANIKGGYLSGLMGEI